MYEAVRADPAGESTAARFAAAASEHGYDGVVVRNSRDDVVPPTFDSRAAYAEAIEAEYGADAVWGVELGGDRGTLTRAVRESREDVTILCVAGGGADRNRFAVETPAVDVLTRPMTERGDFNHVLARAAAENGVRVEFDFGPVLRASGGERVQALRDLRKLREILFYYDAPYVCSVCADSHLHLRAPRDLAALGEQIGFTGEQVREGFREWGRLVERNRERFDDSFIAPGVRKGRGDVR